MDNKLALISNLAEKYVQGRLEGDDLSQFRELSKGEDEQILNEEIIFHQKLQKTATEVERASIENHCFDLIATIETEKNALLPLAESIPEPKSIGIGNRFKKWKLMTGVAATILAAWFFIYLITTPISPSMDVLASQHWDNTSRITEMGRTANKPDNKAKDIGKESLHKAAVLFMAKNYSKANEVLSTVPNSSDFYLNTLILRGVNAYKMDEKEMSIKLLKQASSENENLIFQEAKWRLALVYLLEKDYTNAKERLKELQYTQGYEHKVQELLQKLSK